MQKELESALEKGQKAKNEHNRGDKARFRSLYMQIFSLSYFNKISIILVIYVRVKSQIGKY